MIFAFAPGEFLVDGGEEVLVVEADKFDGEAFAGEVHLGATGEMLSTGVHAEVEGLLLRIGDEAEMGAVGDDDGTEGEVVGADGCDDEASAVGGEDRSAAAEGVGRGTCGGGHNEAVTGVCADEVAVGEEVGAEEGAVVEAVEADFVEGKGGEAVVALPCNHMEQGAGLDGVATSEEVGHEGVDVVAASGGEEAEMAEVDAQHGDVAVTDKVHGAEEGAVASNGEEEIVGSVGEGVDHLFGFDIIVVKDLRELLEFLAQSFLKITDEYGYFHFIKSIVPVYILIELSAWWHCMR